MAWKAISSRKSKVSAEEKYYLASQWQLMWRKFLKHKLAIMGSAVVGFLAILALFCEFFATQGLLTEHEKFVNVPPQPIHFFSEKGFHLRPFVYGLEQQLDPTTFKRTYKEDKTKRYPIYFFIPGESYKMWGLFKMDLHFLGVKEGDLFLFGTDKLGRDLYSRVLYATRTSLSVGLIGVMLSFILGCVLGGISGYYGGAADMIIQRIIELLTSIPTIPLWMALSAALPPHWSSIKVYFGVTMILALRNWCGLGRVVRGRLLELREEDFVMAARFAGLTDGKIIIKHLLPSTLSYLIVNLTLSIPHMILGETALSFLGLGIRPPAVSWGTLMYDAQNVRTIALHPWILIPALFVIVTVLAFNFLGDGLRDAADPYK